MLDRLSCYVNWKERFEKDCKEPIRLTKLFIPVKYQEGTLLNMQSCYVKGNTAGLEDAMSAVKKSD